MYSHTEYVQACNVKFANISRACLHGVSETYVGVVECKHGENPDEDLMPFFLSNPELVMYYCNINEDSHRHARAQEYLESINYVNRHKRYRNTTDEKFYCDHNAYLYAEDTWTRRLFMATKLRYTTLDTEYTAVFRGAQCNSVILQQMPEGTPANILLSMDPLIYY